MAGNVPAHLVLSRDGNGWEIHPLVCPVADNARREAGAADVGLFPRCMAFDPGRGRRTCPYWYATVDYANSTERVDGSIIHGRVAERGKMQARIAVLCIGQRRNRPPGV